MIKGLGAEAILIQDRRERKEEYLNEKMGKSIMKAGKIQLVDYE